MNMLNNAVNQLLLSMYPGDPESGLPPFDESMIRIEENNRITV